MTTTNAPITSRGRVFWLVFALFLAVGSYQINNSMVGPANAQIIQSLHSDPATIGLGQTLFLLVGAVSAIIVTRIGDWAGRRRFLLLSILVLMAGTLLTAIAPNAGVFVVGRAIAGVSGAVYSFAYLICIDNFTLKTFSMAIAIIAACKGGLGGIESVASGFLVDSFGFRSIFWVMLGFNAIAVIVGRALIPESPKLKVERIDWPGAILISGGLTAVSLVLAKGSKWGWLSVPTILIFLVGIAALVAFALVERRAATPLMRTSELKSRNVWPLLTANIVILSGGFSAVLFLLPILAQNTAAGFGMNALETALVFSMPASIIGFPAAVLAGKLAPRVGWRVILLVGMALTCAGLILLAAFSTNAPVAFAVNLGLGVVFTGFVYTALDSLGVLLASKDAPGALPGFNSAAFGIGASLGIALIGGLVTTLQVDGHATHTGYMTALWVCAGLAIVGGLIAMLIPKTGVGAVRDEAVRIDQTAQVD